MKVELNADGIAIFPPEQSTQKTLRSNYRLERNKIYVEPYKGQPSRSNGVIRDRTRLSSKWRQSIRVSRFICSPLIPDCKGLCTVSISSIPPQYPSQIPVIDNGIDSGPRDRDPLGSIENLCSPISPTRVYVHKLGNSSVPDLLRAIRGTWPFRANKRKILQFRSACFRPRFSEAATARSYATGNYSEMTVYETSLVPVEYRCAFTDLSLTSRSGREINDVSGINTADSCLVPLKVAWNSLESMGDWRTVTSSVFPLKIDCWEVTGEKRGRNEGSWSVQFHDRPVRGYEGKLIVTEPTLIRVSNVLETRGRPKYVAPSDKSYSRLCQNKSRIHCQGDSQESDSR